MPHDVPRSDNYTGLSRTVLVYSERFARIVESLKDSDLSGADWASLEDLVDLDNFVRRGVFLTQKPKRSTGRRTGPISRSTAERRTGKPRCGI